MGQAFKCDGCGDLQEGTPALDYRLHRAMSEAGDLPKRGDVELCGPCAQEFSECIMEVVDE